jgi:hypothetical protein
MISLREQEQANAQQEQKYGKGIICFIHVIIV